MRRLKELREDRDLKQSDLAKMIGTTPATISRYETGEIALSPDLICKFCDIYGVTADYLLGRSVVREPVMSDDDFEILDAYHAADQNIQNAIETLLRPWMEVRSKQERLEA